MVFSKITAIILAGLSVQYVVDGLTATGMITPRAGLKQLDLNKASGAIIAIDQGTTSSLVMDAGNRNGVVAGWNLMMKRTLTEV